MLSASSNQQRVFHQAMAWRAKYNAPNTTIATRAIKAYLVIRCRGDAAVPSSCFIFSARLSNIMFSLASATVLLIDWEHKLKLESYR
jgi:hypothetical protein